MRATGGGRHATTLTRTWTDYQGNARRNSTPIPMPVPVSQSRFKLGVKTTTGAYFAVGAAFGHQMASSAMHVATPAWLTHNNIHTHTHTEAKAEEYERHRDTPTGTPLISALNWISPSFSLIKATTSEPSNWPLNGQRPRATAVHTTLTQLIAHPSA